MIFDLIEVYTLICLGVTCKRLYAFLKTRHPPPTCLDTKELITCCYSYRHIEQRAAANATCAS